MPPSEHRQRSAHSSMLHRRIRRQDATSQAASASHSSQDAQITSTNFQDQGKFVRDPVVSRNIAIGTVIAIAGTSLLIIIVAFILTLYMKRKLRKLPGATSEETPVADDWSWTEVGTFPVKEKSFSFSGCKEDAPEDRESGELSPAHLPTPPPLSPLCIDDGHKSSPVISTALHLPSFTFTMPSPVALAPMRGTRVSDTDLGSRHTSLLENCMKVLMADNLTADYSAYSDGNEDSATLHEHSWSSNDSRQSSSGAATPAETTFMVDAENQSQDHSDAEESDKSSWELLTKLRRLLPSSPPKLSASSGPDSSNVVVRRSFTSPAVFTLVPAATKSAVCLKPCALNKRESITSNYILNFLEGQEALGPDLMDESLPPPAIVVSAPTASTLNLCRSSMRGLDQFADADDVWPIAYGASPNRNGPAPPAAFDMELSKRRGDSSFACPPRPPKSRRRTFVQMQVED